MAEVKRFRYKLYSDVQYNGNVHVHRGSLLRSGILEVDQDTFSITLDANKAEFGIASNILTENSSDIQEMFNELYTTSGPSYYAYNYTIILEGDDEYIRQIEIPQSYQNYLFQKSLRVNSTIDYLLLKKDLSAYDKYYAKVPVGHENTIFTADTFLPLVKYKDNNDNVSLGYWQYFKSFDDQGVIRRGAIRSGACSRAGNPTGVPRIISELDPAEFCRLFLNLDTVPAGEDDTTTTGGGTGVYNFSSDSVDIAGTPTVTSVDAGFCRTYVPTLQQLSDFSGYLWSGFLSVADNIKKIFQNPMDAVISLNILPFSVAKTETAENIKFADIDTGVNACRATEQFKTIDCGNIIVNEQYGSFLDYAPYTKCSIYLPYCGLQHLNIDDIMGKTVNVKYIIDIQTGGGVAYILVNGTVMYSYPMECAMNIPVTGNDWTKIYTGILTAIGTAVTMGVSVAGSVSAGKAAAATAGKAASTAAKSSVESTLKSMGLKENDIFSKLGLELGVKVKGSDKTYYDRESIFKDMMDEANKEAFKESWAQSKQAIKASVGQNVGLNSLAVAHTIAGSKMAYTRSGNFGGITGFLNIQKPYIIFEIPKQSLPEDFAKYNGYPCNVKYSLGSLTGYTEVNSIFLDDLSATSEEKSMIAEQLAGGVIF